jgi:hypothetical protein
MVLTGGVHLSVGSREGERVPGYHFGVRGNGPWARSSAGLIRSPGPVFLFSFLFFFFFFCFLISFVSFAKMLQINSNHFQNFQKKNNAMI